MRSSRRLRSSRWGGRTPFTAKLPAAFAAATGSPSAGPSAGRRAAADCRWWRIPCRWRRTSHRAGTAGRTPAPSEFRCLVGIGRGRRCPAIARTRRSDTRWNGYSLRVRTSPSPRWCWKAARPVAATASMSTAAGLAMRWPPPRFRRMPTPPRRREPSATESCLDGSSPQVPLIDDEQAQGHRKESGGQPDRVHSPLPAGDRTDQRAGGEREDKCAVDPERPA